MWQDHIVWEYTCPGARIVDSIVFLIDASVYSYQPIVSAACETGNHATRGILRCNANTGWIPGTIAPVMLAFDGKEPAV